MSSDFDFQVSGDDWNQDGAWYNTLPLMERMGIKVERSTFKKVLRQACKKLGIAREELNIVASPWATMYYKGKWSPIGYEDIEELSKKGTDIAFTEKGDIAKVVGKHASRDGVAFVNTRGHLSEYAEDLGDLAEESGGHIGITIDYDIPGILIASKLVKKGVLWLGVDENMLRHFGLNKENKHIVVSYNPRKARMTEDNFKELVNSTDGFRGNVDIEFLKRKKIELNAVLANVGGERLWEYYKKLLGDTYPTRDYNRAIDSHPDLKHHYPMGIRIFNEYIKEHENSIVKKDVDEIESELGEVEGFINVPEKEKEVDNRLGTIIENDELLKEVGTKLEEVFKVRDTKRWTELAKKIEEQDNKDEESEDSKSNDEQEKITPERQAEISAAKHVGLSIDEFDKSRYLKEHAPEEMKKRLEREDITLGEAYDELLGIPNDDEEDDNDDDDEEDDDE